MNQSGRRFIAAGIGRRRRPCLPRRRLRPGRRRCVLRGRDRSGDGCRSLEASLLLCLALRLFKINRLEKVENRGSNLGLLWRGGGRKEHRRFQDWRTILCSDIRLRIGSQARLSGMDPGELAYLLHLRLSGLKRVKDRLLGGFLKYLRAGRTRQEAA